eukprot:4582823-Prymnesium_polylepis.2
MPQTKSCVLHWDLENLPIPSGCSAASVANRVKEAVRQTYPVLLDSFVYCDVSKTPKTVRGELASLGFDLVPESQDKWTCELWLVH